MGIAPVEYALYAKVHSQSWLCHRGSFQGSSQSTTPFDEADLVLKDLGADLWVEGMERLRKRVRPRLRLGALAEGIHRHAEALNHVAARAHLKAGEIRADDRPIDDVKALAGYEPNTFIWTGGSRADVVFLWTIPSNDGLRRLLTTT